MSLVSIILPVTGAERDLSGPVDSILKQTYKGLELLLVNMSGNKSSEVMCEQFLRKDSRVRIVPCNCTSVGAALNCGIRSSSGDYLLFCDGSGSFDPTLLERALPVAEKYSCDILKFGVRIAEAYANGRSFVVEYSTSKFRLFTASEFPEKYIHAKKDGVCCNALNSLFKKSFITENSVIFNEKLCERWIYPLFALDAFSRSTVIVSVQGVYLSLLYKYDDSDVRDPEAFEQGIICLVNREKAVLDTLSCRNKEAAMITALCEAVVEMSGKNSGLTVSRRLALLKHLRTEKAYDMPFSDEQLSSLKDIDSGLFTAARLFFKGHYLRLLAFISIAGKKENMYI